MKSIETGEKDVNVLLSKVKGSYYGAHELLFWVSRRS